MKTINLKSNIFNNKRNYRELTDREKAILQKIIHLYILTATPIGSRFLSKYLEKEMKLSPATIRNIMADLEEMEYISHPHTSAGRVPTDKGYRVYVDALMNLEKLAPNEKRKVDQELMKTSSESILKEASKVLGMISRYLGIVELPNLSTLVIQKIDLVMLSSNKLLVVIALNSNLVRTVTLEINFEIDTKTIDEIINYINERISGKTLQYIRDNFAYLIKDFSSEEVPLVRLFIDSIDRLFKEQSSTERIHIAGTQNLLYYPEFEDLEKARGVIELFDNEDIVIHILDKYEKTDQEYKVLIGKEMESELLENYSLIVSNYKIGTTKGAIGLIGPRRMNYSKMVTLVQYVANVISYRLKNS